MNNVTYPTKTEAIHLFEDIWRETQNAEIFDRELWKQHSYLVAQGAACIAARLSGGDAEKAFALGLLHDIGKARDYRGKKHALEGYRLLMEQGYSAAAYAALTHDFPVKAFDIHRQEALLTDEEVEFVVSVLDPYDYTLFDRIVQVCDAISMPQGFVLMEKRMMTAVLRYGLSESMKQIIHAAYKNMAFIEERLGCSVYAVLPQVIENTFIRQADDVVCQKLRQL